MPNYLNWHRLYDVEGYSLDVFLVVKHLCPLLAMLGARRTIHADVVDTFVPALCAGHLDNAVP